MWRRRLGRRDTLARRQLEDLERGVVDLRRLRLRSFEVEAVELVGDLDHASRVDHEVGTVEDAALQQAVVESVVGELVVRRAADHCARMASTLASVIAPPRAHGARTSSSARDHRLVVGEQLDLRLVCGEPTPMPPRRRRWRRSSPRRRAAKSMRWRPTLPIPITPMRRPASPPLGPAERRAPRASSIHAEGGEHAGVAGSAAASLRPVTYSHVSATMSMSAT